MVGSMGSSAVIDVCIGLALLYLTLSVICTTVNEVIAQLLSLRARTLAGGIERLIDDDGLREAFRQSGFIDATRAVSKGLPSYGTIQPAILTLLADVEGIGSGLTMEVICNVGAIPLLTGEDEGWKLHDTPAYGTFEPAGVGISHLSLKGVSIDCGAGDRKRE